MGPHQSFEFMSRIKIPVKMKNMLVCTGRKLFQPYKMIKALRFYRKAGIIHINELTVHLETSQPASPAALSHDHA